MGGDAARALDAEFPNLERDVVDGYRNAPENRVAEILAGAVVPEDGCSSTRPSCTSA